MEFKRIHFHSNKNLSHSRLPNRRHRRGQPTEPHPRTEKEKETSLLRTQSTPQRDAFTKNSPQLLKLHHKPLCAGTSPATSSTSQTMKSHSPNSINRRGLSYLLSLTRACGHCRRTAAAEDMERWLAIAVAITIACRTPNSSPVRIKRAQDSMDERVTTWCG